MKIIPLSIIGTMLCVGLIAFIPGESEAEPTWVGSHLYVDQWLYFEVGTLDQGTEIEYGVKVTTPDESVNVAFMDSTNYVAFESDVETFVGWNPQYQVRSLESSTEIPYQQMWYFVVVSDTWSEIDIEYYVNVVESDDGGICGGAFVIGAMAIIAMIGVVAVIRKR